MKGVERPTRDLARQSAQAAGQTVGAWIEQAIRAHATLLAPGRPANESRAIEPAAEAATAQLAEVRSLEDGVVRAEARTNDLVIPVALKVQELAHRLVEIEQARVSGRARPAPEPEPPPEPEPAHDPDDPFPPLPPRTEPAEPEPIPNFEQPEPEVEPEWKPRSRPAADAFPDPVPPSEATTAAPSPFLLEVAAAETAAEGRPNKRSWVRPRHRTQKKKKPSRFKRLLTRAAAAVVALGLGAGSSVLVLEHGELIGLPPRLVDHVAVGLDKAAAGGIALLHEGNAALDAAEDAVYRWIGEMRRMIETDEAAPSDPEEKPAPAEPSKSETPSAPEASAPPRIDAPPQTAAIPTPSATPLPSDPAKTTVAPPQAAPAPSFPTLVQPAEEPPVAREAGELEKVARQGDVKAQYELGVLAVQPESGPPDYGKAAYWFREAAVQGNQSAQYNLGVLYEHGLGVGQDDVRALLWYHSAAEQGHARAQYNLGVFYAQGRGIPTDYTEAQRWFRRAADQGIAKAFYNLAVLADSGLGSPANPVAARAYMSRAALMGDPEARAALADAAKKPLPKPDPAKADPAKPDAARSDPTRPTTEVIGAVQHLLAELGYDPGRIDGMLGDKTRQAIRKFQTDTGLPQTGLPSDDLLETLSAKVGPSMTAAAKSN